MSPEERDPEALPSRRWTELPMGLAPLVYTPEATRRRVRLMREIVGQHNVGSIWKNERLKTKNSTGGGQVACSQGRDVQYSCFCPPGLLALSLLDLKSRGTKDRLAHAESMLSREEEHWRGEKPVAAQGKRARAPHERRRIGGGRQLA